MSRRPGLVILQALLIASQVFVIGLLVGATAAADQSAGSALSTMPLDPIFVPPSWLQGVILWVKAIPALGPAFVQVSLWAGVIATILTHLSMFLLGLEKAFDRIASISPKLQFLGTAADKISFLNQYVKYFSMLNSDLGKTDPPKKE